MKSMTVALLAVLAAAALPCSHASNTDPIQKVIQMISDLEAKILSEGSDAQKVYDEFAEFCEDRSKELSFEIKTGKGNVKDLEAAIEKETATAESLNAKIEELSGAISTDEQDLKAATEIREKEQAAFEAEEKELMEVLDTLTRATGIIEKEMNKGGALVQLKSTSNVVQALSVMVEATSLSTADAAKLSAFLQNQQESSDEDSEMGAPAATVYKSGSGGILGTLEDLHDKGEAQLEAARGAETKNVQAYQMLASSLKDEIKFANKDLDKAKKNLGASDEAKAAAQGDLEVTTKDLAEDEKDLATMHQDCMKGAEDFEAETKSRGEELKALATAKKIITETTSGAAGQSYSFVQVSMSSGNFEVVRFVRELAQKQKSTALTQLASRIMAASRSSDPFAKVKGLISDMIEKLLAEAEADATEKAYCDKEMAETETKKADKEAAIQKLSTQIDSMTAKTAKLKEEVATLQKELAALAKA